MKQKDDLDPIQAEGMPHMADSLFAIDFLLAAKNSVRNCAYALSETASPEVRAVLRKQLTQAINLHEEIAGLMIKNEWLNPYELSQQVQLDEKAADMITQIADMQLYPRDTDRLGNFATPNK
ncbi:spore coat protein [Paenibacillus terreus]|uniref:Spore coat protein n=1 Tax=Paenibacillus terreus TaxID=1387834 RepID=A0ABV5B714_9BACL